MAEIVPPVCESNAPVRATVDVVSVKFLDFSVALAGGVGVVTPTHPPTHPLSHSLAQPPTHPLTHSLISTRTHALQATSAEMHASCPKPRRPQDNAQPGTHSSGQQHCIARSAVRSQRGFCLLTQDRPEASGVSGEGPLRVVRGCDCWVKRPPRRRVLLLCVQGPPSSRRPCVTYPETCSARPAFMSLTAWHHRSR